MRTTITIALFTFVGSYLKAQPQFSYAPDSSVLSILFSKEGKIDRYKPKLALDLTGKWTYKKADSVNVRISGSYGIVDDINNPKHYTTINCNIFSNKYSVKIKSGNFTIIKKISIKKIFLNPNITLHCPLIKKNKDGMVWIDSYDIQSIIK